MTKEEIKKNLDPILCEFKTAETYYCQEGIVASYLLSESARMKVFNFAGDHGIRIKPFGTIHVLLFSENNTKTATS